jgi:hypothetical protein
MGSMRAQAISGIAVFLLTRQVCCTQRRKIAQRQIPTRHSSILKKSNKKAAAFAAAREPLNFSG